MLQASYVHGFVANSCVREFLATLTMMFISRPTFVRKQPYSHERCNASMYAFVAPKTSTAN